MARLTQNLTDIEYSLGGLVFSHEKIAEMLQYGGGEALQAALPYWGLLHGAINVGNAIDTLRHSNTRDSLPTGNTEKYTTFLANLFSSAQLGYQSYQALTSSSLGSFSPFFYASFAMNAGIDFFVALYDFAKAHRKQTEDKSDLTYDPCLPEDVVKIKSEALRKVITKGLAAIGWAMLACGNPMGWFIVAGGALLSAYFFGKNNPSAFNFFTKDSTKVDRIDRKFAERSSQPPLPDDSDTVPSITGAFASTHH